MALLLPADALARVDAREVSRASHPDSAAVHPVIAENAYGAAVSDRGGYTR